MFHSFVLSHFVCYFIATRISSIVMAILVSTLSFSMGLLVVVK